jgi:hypothetical protein
MEHGFDDYGNETSTKDVAGTTTMTTYYSSFNSLPNQQVEKCRTVVNLAQPLAYNMPRD